ncbi:hypothetical protein [Parvibaculum sp.]|uniref:hypothetical protein n=1 Tax=Parvibaculum sp. TaxID=2024848 RepID=UPI00272F567E|nr:hypothetical protein [Parvibaculum sp.]MDP1628832.1 hypothetical protein [Parvibaculum sp.]MDP2148227.1 hypothetical protein [Parvibaculum sp.]MDP3326649.1 hypothetical protein [Parvibaculum sp.]
MTEPLFEIDRRFTWAYAGDVLTVTDAATPAFAGAGAAMQLHGDLAGRIADGLQHMEMAGTHMPPVLSLLWHALAAGAAGLVVPAHEAPPHPSARERAPSLSPQGRGKKGAGHA